MYQYPCCKFFVSYSWIFSRLNLCLFHLNNGNRLSLCTKRFFSPKKSLINLILMHAIFLHVLILFKSFFFQLIFLITNQRTYIRAYICTFKSKRNSKIYLFFTMDVTNACKKKPVLVGRQISTSKPHPIQIKLIPAHMIENI